MCQHMEVWFLTLYVLMDYLIQIDRIKMELFIVYLFNMRSQGKYYNFYVHKDFFTLTNSSYPNEMQHLAVLHLGLRCLSKFSLRSQMVKNRCTAIYCSPRREGKEKHYISYMLPFLSSSYCFKLYLPCINEFE